MSSAPALATARSLAVQLRLDSVRCSTAAGSGHPTSSLSAADLMAVLLLNHFRYDWSSPELPTNDHLVFSKGHASPLLYAMFRAVGVVSEEELLTTYRRFGSRLQGHPPPVLPWVDLAKVFRSGGSHDDVALVGAGVTVHQCLAAVAELAEEGISRRGWWTPIR